MENKEEVIELLDETLELNIPEELLNASTKEEFIESLEKTIELKIPKEVIENNELINYIERIPKKHLKKLKRRKIPVKALIFSSSFIVFSLFLFTLLNHTSIKNLFGSISLSGNITTSINQQKTKKEEKVLESTNVELYNFEENNFK